MVGEGVSEGEQSKWQMANGKWGEGVWREHAGKQKNKVGRNDMLNSRNGHSSMGAQHDYKAGEAREEQPKAPVA